jgi:hypothetical protein
MADIHGMPDASMVTPMQGFQSEPLPDVTSQFDAANALTGAGVLYGRGPRQREAETLLDSPQGAFAGGGTSGPDITAGWSGEPDESWANNVQMVDILETPIQGHGDYPGTMQDGLQTYGC